MNYWIIKSEPSTYSWDELAKEKKTAWTGIRNFQARNYLKEMQKGEVCLFYHSGNEKQIIGKSYVDSNFYQDPTSNDTNWVAVDIKTGEKFEKSITLEQIKNQPELKNIGLLRQPRLSVIKLAKEEFDIIIKMTLKK
ncbi:MAG: EVE domain-containing protein [Bacteroidetes bacterium]|nr:EVE domain-containing protein [Bacteroidota bacterium]